MSEMPCPVVLRSMEEMLARTPDGLETPRYKVISSAAAWEVREYEEFSVCSTAIDRPVEGGDAPQIQQPSLPAAGGFQALAGYIFGRNEEGEKMAMTTPVLSQRSAEGRMQMSFVLPARFWDGGRENAVQAPSPTLMPPAPWSS